MNILNVTKNFTRVIGRSGLVLRKIAPELLTYVGIGGTVVSTVLACRATLKVESVLNNAKDRMELIEAVHNGEVELKEGETYTEKDYHADLMQERIQTGTELVKLYAPVVGLGAMSIGCICGGHHILNSRNAALAAAYKTLDEGFKMYRSNVIAEEGEQADFRFRNGLKADEIEVKKHKTASGKTVEEIVAKPNSTTMATSVYAREFDARSPFWYDQMEYNVVFLKQRQSYLNDLLHSRGHLFLNEAYEYLGIPHSKEGQIVGWVDDSEDGDHYIDFGISEEKYIAIARGDVKSIWLDFNVDGNIWDKMEESKGLSFRRQRNS